MTDTLFKWCDGCISAHACAMCGKCQVQAAPVPQDDGDEQEAFEWPPLPALPDQGFYAHDRALFTEHQMQGYANAYGEAVRAALASKAAPIAVAEPVKVQTAFEDYRRGLMEAFHVANMINANRQGRTAEETCAYLVRSLAELANGGEPPAPISSPSEAVYDTSVVKRIATQMGWGPAGASSEEAVPVAWIQGDHLEKAKQAPFLCRVEPAFREGMGFVPIHTHPAAAQPSRAEVLEEAALLVEQGQETITQVGDGEENRRHITPRRHGNLMGLAYAEAIRALKEKP